jgi:type IV secretion system protein VirB1
MILTAPQTLALAAACSGGAEPKVLASIAEVESGLDTLAINVNGKRPRRLFPADEATAAEAAGQLIARGLSVDLGLSQINSKNLSWLGETPSELFDPCRNLAAAAQILSRDLARADAGLAPPAQLDQALSFYNTGDRRRGFSNGYVAKVEAARAGIEALAASGEPPVARAAAEPRRAAWDVFAAPRRLVLGFVINLQGTQP